MSWQPTSAVLAQTGSCRERSCIILMFFVPTDIPVEITPVDCRGSLLEVQMLRLQAWGISCVPFVAVSTDESEVAFKSASCKL